MRTGWGDTAARGRAPRPRRPTTPAAAAALAAAFPGETLVIPSGREKVRANDTDVPVPARQRLHLAHRRARPGLGTDHRPTATATTPLYIRPRSPRDTDEFFRNAVYGELWIGRRHTLAEKADRAGHRDGAPGRARRRRWPAAPRRATRVLRGYDPMVDAAVLPYDTGRGRHPRPRAGHDAVRAAPGQGRVGDRPAAGRDRRHRARLRGRGPRAAGRPAGHRAPPRGHLRAAGPPRRQRRSATPRSSGPARTPRSCTGSATPAPPRPASCC